MRASALPRPIVAIISTLLLISDLPAAPATAAAAAADGSTPGDAMRALVDAIEREDEAAIAATVVAESDAARRFARVYARAEVAMRRYWRAATRRWGRRECIEAYVRRGLRLPDAHLEFPDVEWDVQGDRAVLRYDPGRRYVGAPSPLRKVDGRWLYDPFPRARPREIEHAAARAEETAAKIEKLTADVEAGRLASVHEAVDVLYPHQRGQPRPEPPELTQEQLDPRTIGGAMMSLGKAYEVRDARAAADFYHVDGPAAAARELAEVYARRVLAVHDLLGAVASQFDGSEIGLLEFGLTDPRDDLFGHLITQWTIDGDRATGTNDAGPADATMRRVKGVWKIDLTPPPGSPPADQVAAELRRQTKIISAVTYDVREKRLFTVDEVRAALKRRGLAPSTQPAEQGRIDE